MSKEPAADSSPDGGSRRPRKTFILLLACGLLALAVLAHLQRDNANDRKSYTVVRGDSLSLIAQREGTTVNELRRWNAIRGDLIEVGQVLWIEQASGSKRPGFAPKKSGKKARTSPAPRPGQRATRKGPKGSKAQSVRPQTMGGLEMEAFFAEEEPPPTPLVMPPPRPCLAADTGIENAASFGRSQGLSHGQIQAAVAGFQKESLRCYREHPKAEGALRLHLVVGCDGRVRNSRVAHDETNSAAFAACVAKVFGFAPFPSHARETVEFEVPLSFVADQGEG